MASNLSPLGSLSYNGVSFGVYTGSEVSVRPVYSEDGRTVVWNQYTFTIRSLIHGSPTDSQVTFARRALSKPGGAFVYKDRGLGDISVNVGGVRDVAWGPKPRDVQFRHVGADQAVEVSFALDVAIPDCSAARYAFAPAELSYEVAFNIDRAGWTTLTYSGHLKVPITRRSASDRGVPDSADHYREKLHPKPIPGFRPPAANYTLSPDRTALKFTFTYEEMGLNAPPPGVVDVQASLTMNTSTTAYTLWVATLSAHYEMAKNGDLGAATEHFMDLVTHYLDRAERQIQPDKDGRRGFPIPFAFGVSEPEIYGRPRADFSCTWRWASSLPGVLGQSGLWEPVPGSGWAKWAQSMGRVLGPRGVSGVTFDTNAERIVDLCAPPGGPGTGRPRPPTPRTRPPRFHDLVSCPPPDQSWLDYRCWLETEVEQGVAELRTLPETLIGPKETGAELRSGGAGTVSGNLRDIQPDAGKIPGYIGGGGDVPPTVVERRAAPLVVVYLCGWATRVCHPIPAPAISGISGKKATPANRLDRGEGFKGPALGGNLGGLPVYVARWRLRYVLEEAPPGNVPVPPNPVM